MNWPIACDKCQGCKKRFWCASLALVEKRISAEQWKPDATTTLSSPSIFQSFSACSNPGIGFQRPCKLEAWFSPLSSTTMPAGLSASCAVTEGRFDREVFKTHELLDISQR